MSNSLPWSGKWWSTIYPRSISRGNIRLKHFPLDTKDALLTVKAEIEYLGMYRLRQKETVNVSFNPQQDTAAALEQFKAYDHENKEQAGQLHFTVVEKSHDRIKGTYTLTTPEDRGTFEIRRGEDFVDGCSIQ